MTHWTDYEGAEYECDHEPFDLDILIGRATCEVCGYAWYPSQVEIEAIGELEEMNLSDLPPNTVVCQAANDELPF